MLKNHPKDGKTKSVGRTLEILSSFIDVSPRQRTIDVAQQLHMDISTVSRHLNTLLDWGFLGRDDVTGLYYPGVSIIALAGQALQSSELFRNASFTVQKLAFEYDVHAYLTMPQGTDIVYLSSCPSESTLDLMIPIGYHHPMYCSAMGRAMLAYMPSNEVDKILENSDMEQYTAATLVDPKKIREELVQVRRKGYCVLVNELVQNNGSIAVPIFDRMHQPIGAISVSERSYKMEEGDRKEELSRATLDAAAVISAKMGWHPK